METVYFPVACTIDFAHSGIRKIAARSLHSFKVEKFYSKTVNLTAPDGAVAYGVWSDAFERLPAGYIWAKFKEQRVLSSAKRRSGESWNWQPETVTFEASGIYAIKMLPPDDGQSDSCNFQTKNRKIFPYVDRGYFSVVSETSQPALPRVLEAFPLPIPGVQRAYEPGVWDVPTEYDSIPITYEDYIFSRFKHATVKPVAALRLDFEAGAPLYRCSYFGPANKIKL